MFKVELQQYALRFVTISKFLFKRQLYIHTPRFFNKLDYIYNWKLLSKINKILWYNEYMYITFFDIVFVLVFCIILFIPLFQIWMLFFQKPFRQKRKIHPQYGARYGKLYVILSDILFSSGGFGKIEFYKNVIIVQQIWSRTILDKTNFQELTPLKQTKFFNLFQMYRLKIMKHTPIYILLSNYQYKFLEHQISNLTKNRAS